MHPLLLGLRHVAISVRNVRESVQFYCAVLNMRIEWEPDPDNIYLTSGTDNLAIHKFRKGNSRGRFKVSITSGSSLEVLRMSTQLRRKSSLTGSNWFTLSRRIATGLAPLFKDPDGILIQLLYHPPAHFR